MNYLISKKFAIILLAFSLASCASVEQLAGVDLALVAFASEENSQTRSKFTHKDNPTKINSGTQENLLAQASEPIQTQPGPYGSEVQLLKAKVAGQILHVSLLYLPSSEEKNKVPWNSIEEVSYIDDNTAQLYGVLKDEAESYLFSAKYINGEQFGIPVDETTPVWFKFPAPSPETQTISINIPGVGPFVEVPLQR